MGQVVEGYCFDRPAVGHDTWGDTRPLVARKAYYATPAPARAIPPAQAAAPPPTPGRGTAAASRIKPHDGRRGMAVPAGNKVDQYRNMAKLCWSS